MKSKCAFLLALCFGMMPGHAPAQDDNLFNISGEITIGAAQNGARQTMLVADPDRFGIEKHHITLTPVINFDMTGERLTITGQGRGEIKRGGDFNDETAMLDEFYAEYAATQNLFLFAGRRNVAFGQAESSYALDVFLDPLGINRTKNIDRRRREVEGEDMLGFEALLTPELTFAGYYLPEQDKHIEGKHPARSLATLSWVLPWRADVEMLVLDDERDGIGFGYTQSVGDAILLHAEALRREGRDRGRITQAANGAPIAHPADTDGFTQITLGGNYTFAGGLAITAEYHHNGNGYSDSEWEGIAELINAYNTSIADTDTAIARTASGNLLRLNGFLRHYTLRRNYGFLRLSHTELFGLAITPELTAFHNLDDNSGTIATRFEIPLGAGTVGLYATAAYGDDGSEFKLRSPNRSIMIYFTAGF